MKRIIKPSKVSASGAGGQAQDKASGASGVSQRSTPVLEKRPLAPKEIRQNQFLKCLQEPVKRPAYKTGDPVRQGGPLSWLPLLKNTYRGVYARAFRR